MRLVGMKNMKIRTQLILTALIFTMLVSIVGLFLFVNINKILNTKANDSTKLLIDQVDNEISKYFDDINNTANTIIFLNQIQDFINNNENQHSYDLYKSINLIINNIITSNTDISGLFIQIKDMRLSFNDINVRLDDFDSLYLKKNQTYYSRLLSDSTLESNSTSKRYFAVVNPIYNIRNPVSSTSFGKITFVLDKSFFDKISSRYNLTENSNLYIINNHNEIVSKKNSTNNNSPSDRDIIINSLSSNDSSALTIDNIKYIYHKKDIGETGWKIVSLIPSVEYFKELSDISRVTFMLFTLAILVILFISVYIIANINFPIQKLLSSMEIVSKGDLKERSTIKLDNEIGKLSKYFNNMMDEVYSLTNRIFENQQKLYEFELANKDARLIALQSQINPHFLYNTLGCIQSIALHYHVNEISEVAKALARIFRYSIKENDFVLVSAEVENLRSYVLIEKIKSLDKIKFDIDISEEIMNKTIIKLILQPIVENAVMHGLNDTTEDGVLSVKGSKEGNYLIFMISDNGIGMPPEKVAELNNINQGNLTVTGKKDRSIGILNVKQRLNLCYNNDFNFNIKSSPENGTTVYIRIPCMEGDISDTSNDS